MRQMNSCAGEGGPEQTKVGIRRCRSADRKRHKLYGCGDGQYQGCFCGGVRAVVLERLAVLTAEGVIVSIMSET